MIIHSTSSLDLHVQSVCKSAFLHVRNLSKIRRNLPYQCVVQIAHAFVTSRLDYCNSLLHGASEVLVQKLQRVLNTTARMVCGTRKFDHITPTLVKLHWLPVRQRIAYKIALLTFRCLQGLSPVYLRELVVEHKPSRVLRSSHLPLTLSASRINTALAERSFRHAASSVWNALPANVRESSSVATFKTNLKTYLFTVAYL
jgi:hypothetical protein